MIRYEVFVRLSVRHIIGTKERSVNIMAATLRYENSAFAPVLNLAFDL